MDTNEVKAYCETIPKLIELEKTYCNGESKVAKIMPKFYAGGADKETRGFFLIMEDLSDNYVMVNKKKKYIFPYKSSSCCIFQNIFYFFLPIFKMDEIKRKQLLRL